MPFSKPVVVGSAIAAGAVAIGIGGLTWYYGGGNQTRSALLRVRSYFYPSPDEGFVESSQNADESAKERKILFLGLDNSGKTELLRDLAAAATDRLSGFEGGGLRMREQTADVKPTEGIKVTTVVRNGRTYHLWEVGGRTEYRRYWSHFFEDTNLLVFVIDAADPVRLPEAYAELKILAAEPKFKNTPFVVVANKQNLNGAVGSETIEEESNIVGLRKGAGPVVLFATSRGLQSHEDFYEKLFDFCDSVC